jgi:hypothetical protein
MAARTLPARDYRQRRKVWWNANSMLLSVAQSLCVALPAAGVPLALHRFRSGAWALVLPLCIAVVIGAIDLTSSTADILTWVALILVPIGCALALGWAAHGARWGLAPGGGGLRGVAWADQHTTAGQLATVALIVGSAVTLGRLLAGAAPLVLLKVGIIVMAISDAILCFNQTLEAPNNVLIAATPGAGLPQLQSASFHASDLGYGDFFAAAVVGGILAMEGRRQWPAAVATLAVIFAWKQIFLIYDGVLPVTVPPAIVLTGYLLADLRGALRAPRPRARLSG